MGRRPLQVFSTSAFAALLSSACGGPVGLLPLAARSLTPEEQTVAVPTEDGSHYILVEARPRTSNVGLARKWRHTAVDACRGDFLLLSSGTSTRRRGGTATMRIQEGWVRCVSPEAIDEPKIQRGDKPARTAEPKQKKKPGAPPKVFAL